ncbi:MAG: hypothetical protein KAI71_00130 [Candidatus Pacebacteria bacterium]|nr:hypothetical protein [Candidatus Paceibacterota bacterium]
MEKIFPILDFGIAFESSSNVIIIHEKKDGMVKKYIDSTAEVIVELTEEARNLAKDGKVSNEELKVKAGEFFDEALAIREIERLQPLFSVEYYSCQYTPINEIMEIGCDMCGSIEHMQSTDGKCPGCGR